MNRISKLAAIFVAAGTMAAGGARADLPVSGDLKLWLKADAGVTTVGPTNVSVWADQSGNGNDATQGSDPSRPHLVANTLNSTLPVLHFDGNDVFNLAGIPQSTNTTLFMVYNLDATTGGSPHLVGRDGTNMAIYHGLTGGGQVQRPGIYWGGIGIQYSTDISGWNDVRFGTSPTLLEIDVNGGGLQTASVSPVTLSNWKTIGTAQTGIGQNFQGDIAELIIYNRVLNTAERQIVQNNLSAKYALPMAANDRYAGDDTGKGDYDTAVLGVGRVDSSNQLLSGGTASGLALSTTSLADGQFVLGGHKVAVNGFTSDDVTAGVRMERVWYVDATGSPTSDFGITFDFSDAGLGAPSGGSYQLLYSSTNAFETTSAPFSVLSSAYTVAGDQVTFSLNGSSLLDGYYTLAVIPEPSTILLFGAGGALLWFRRRLSKME